ncbi:MAG: DNA modification methylase [Candidatus Cloacimonetes bacterium]|nr:DNA modification methylase [Candidatus Cloacimonadota bacterium]
MQFQDLLNLYKQKEKQYGDKAFQHILELLNEAKELHKNDWLKSPTPSKDHEQSWKAFKGKNLEKLILYIIEEEVKNLGLKVIEGNVLERTKTKNLSVEQNRVKRNLLVDYGEFGAHLPDVDLIVYDPKTCEVIAVISSKVSLRERVAQSGYWKIKLSQDKITRHIKVFFITPDKDRTLSLKRPPKKGRAIVEVDTDGCYIMSEEKVEESDNLKTFDKFIPDLKNLVYAKRNQK